MSSNERVTNSVSNFSHSSSALNCVLPISFFYTEYKEILLPIFHRRLFFYFSLSIPCVFFIFGHKVACTQEESEGRDIHSSSGFQEFFMAKTSKKSKSCHLKSENMNCCTTIDSLPECLLLHILSFLNTLDAVRCSLVSKSWRNLWQSLRSLEFVTYPAKEFKDPFFSSRSAYHNFICGTLCQRPPLPLSKLSICFDYTLHQYISVIDLCTNHAIKFGVTELVLDFFEGGSIDSVVENYDAYNYDPYKFEFSNIINSSVKSLSLGFCYITVPDKTCFETLVSLTLVGVWSEHEMLADLITGCVNLEFLDLREIYDVLNLKVYSAKLKKLRISCFSNAKPDRGETLESSIDICTPCLQSISLISVFAGEYILKCPTPLMEAEVDFPITSSEKAVFTYVSREGEAIKRNPVQRGHVKYWSEVVFLFPEVQCLTVPQLWLQFFSFMISFTDCISFKYLKHLELQTGYTAYDVIEIGNLLRISPLLETMVLNYANCTDANERLPADLPFTLILLQIPHLRVVKMKNFRMAKNEMSFLALLKMQDLVQKVAIEKVILHHAKVGDAPLKSDILDWDGLANFLRTKGKFFPDMKTLI